MGAYPGARSVLADLYTSAVPGALGRARPMGQFALACFLAVGGYQAVEDLQPRTMPASLRRPRRRRARRSPRPPPPPARGRPPPPPCDLLAVARYHGLLTEASPADSPGPAPRPRGCRGRGDHLRRGRGAPAHPRPAGRRRLRADPRRRRRGGPAGPPRPGPAGRRPGHRPDPPGQRGPPGAPAHRPGRAPDRLPAPRPLPPLRPARAGGARGGRPELGRGPAPHLGRAVPPVRRQPAARPALRLRRRRPVAVRRPLPRRRPLPAHVRAARPPHPAGLRGEPPGGRLGQHAPASPPRRRVPRPLAHGGGHPGRLVAGPAVRRVAGGVRGGPLQPGLRRPARRHRGRLRRAAPTAPREPCAAARAATPTA